VICHLTLGDLSPNVNRYGPVNRAPVNRVPCQNSRNGSELASSVLTVADWLAQGVRPAAP
jgi:hypothetical protein